MIPEASEAVRLVLSGVWKMFDMIIPGTFLSVKSYMLGIFVLSFSIVILRYCFGFGDPNITYGARQSKNVKVSKERRGDQK